MSKRQSLHLLRRINSNLLDSVSVEMPSSLIKNISTSPLLSWILNRFCTTGFYDCWGVMSGRNTQGDPWLAAVEYGWYSPQQYTETRTRRRIRGNRSLFTNRTFLWKSLRIRFHSWLFLWYSGQEVQAYGSFPEEESRRRGCSCEAGEWWELQRLDTCCESLLKSN